MRTTPLLSSIALLSLASCAAITGEDDVDGAGGKGDQIDPIDDEDLATLIVELPSNLPGQPAPLQWKLSVDGAEIPSDTPLRFIPGEHSLVLETERVGSQQQQLVLVAGQSQVVKLAAATFQWDTSATGPLAVDVGMPLWVQLWKGEDIVQNLSSEPTDAPRLFFSGTYEAAVAHPALPKLPFTLAPGLLTSVDVTPPDRRATIVVHPPLNRAFPPIAGCPYGNTTRLREDYEYVPEETAHEDTWIHGEHSTITWVDTTQTTTLRVLPFPTFSTHHDIVVSNVATPLSLAPNQTTHVYLKRIDVNDVRVTRENGTTYLVAGEWQLERFVGPSSTDWRPIELKEPSCGTRSRLPTKSGVDVMPGKYRVTIEYVTGEGPQRQEHVLTL